MAAIIISRRNFIDPIAGASRSDLVIADTVDVASVDAATTYAWTLQYAPEGSTAAFSGSTLAASPGFFTVDVAGAYLIRLTVDAGQPSEDTQFVRLRALTEFGQLKLVSAGERRDTSGVIPVDVDVTGWADEQNFNLNTLLAFIKPMVSSGRVLYVDANDGTSGYADHGTVQAAINAAVAATPSATEQWVVLVRPGTYVENIAFADFVHVLGWPGNSDGVSSKSVVFEGFHTAALAIGAITLLANLHIEQNTDSTVATLIKGGDGTLRLSGTRVESNGTDAAQGPAINVASGVFDATHCYFLQNTSNGPTTAPFFQSAASNVVLDDCTLLGPSGSILNDLTVPVVGVFCTMTNCRVIAADASGSAVVTTAESLTIDRCALNAGSDSSINVNAAGAVFAGDVALTVRFSDMGGKDIKFETSGLAGATDLSLGSVMYRALVFPTADPGAVALTQSRTHFYDNTVIGALIAENVQDAIDEIAALAAIAPVVYHKNMPALADDTVRYRGWAPVASSLLFVRVYIQDKGASAGTYELTVTNEATGNTCLSAATFDMYSAVASAVTPVTLTAVPADLLFAAQDAWTIELTSDDPAFDADSVYVSLVFNTATGSGGLAEDLATTLAVGNVTAGNDIIVSSSDRIIGVDAVVASGNPGLDLVLRGGLGDGAGVDGAVKVEGKLTVTGVIDPTGLILEQTPISDTALFPTATQGTFWISDGTLGFPADVPNFIAASSAAVIPLLGGAVQGVGAAGGAPTFPVVSRATALFQATVTASAVMNPTLPAASGTSGWVVYVEHLGDGTGTVNVTPNGGDTIGGAAGPHVVDYGSLVGFITTGGTDWRVLSLGGGGVTSVHKNVVPLPSATFRYEGWAAATGTVTEIRVLMVTKHTTGAATYTAIFTNEATGNTLLVGASYDMQGISAGLVETLILTGVAGDLQFASGDKWSVEFTSTSLGFDGDGIYFDILWGNDPSAFSVPAAPDDDHSISMAVSPGNTINEFFFAPYALTVVGARAYCDSGAVSAAGTYTLAVADADLANNLLAGATFDMETSGSLPAATLTSVPLTATTANLNLAQGTKIQFALASDNADLVASGVYLQIIYRSQ